MARAGGRCALKRTPKSGHLLLWGGCSLPGAADCAGPRQSQRAKSMSGNGYLKFRNDRGVAEIGIGVKEFKCIGESPPQDHPHVYINMGETEIPSLLRDAVPLQSAIDTARSRADGQFICRPKRGLSGAASLVRSNRLLEIRPDIPAEIYGETGCGSVLSSIHGGWMPQKPVSSPASQ